MNSRTGQQTRALPQGPTPPEEACWGDPSGRVFKPGWSPKQFKSSKPACAIPRKRLDPNSLKPIAVAGIHNQCQPEHIGTSEGHRHILERADG